MADLCEAALEGNAEKARAINETLMPLHKDLFCEANPIPVKFALVEMGLMHKGIRLPLTWLSEGCHEKVRTALRQSGVLV
jgi:4-hydroxy-tetrahydrodipicolinate synthase